MTDSATKVVDAEVDNPETHFGIKKQEMLDLVQAYKQRKFSEDIEACQKLGGIEGLSKALKVDLTTGLNEQDEKDKEERDAVFGSNWRPPLMAKSFFSMFIAALDDFMLKVLMVAAVLSITFDMILAEPHHRSHAWIEGFAIMVAVFLVASVGSFVEWKKEVQFVKSRAESDKKNVCKVLRRGEFEEIHHNFIMVGDIIKMEYGMGIPVDSVIMNATQLSLDEAAMTGESDEMKKSILSTCVERMEDSLAQGGNKNSMLASHELPSPVVLSGTNVAAGEGKMMCIVVGDCSCLGEIIKTLVQKPEETPLQKKLE
jgi:magnesium-transporting ATPase (P-type)